jgi:adenosine deaminase
MVGQRRYAEMREALDERLGEADDFVSASRIARDARLLVAPHTGFPTDRSHVRRCVELL